MKYQILEPFKVKTSHGELDLQPGQIINLATDKALKLITEGKITPIERAAYKVYSESLGAFLWVVYGPEDVKALRAQGIMEAIYTGQEITELRKLPKEALKTIHKAKEVFPMSKVEAIKHNEKGGCANV